MKHMLMKIKIPTVTLFWQFKACVMCEIFLKSRHTIMFFQGFSKKKVKFQFGKILVTGHKHNLRGK